MPLSIWPVRCDLLEVQVGNAPVDAADELRDRAGMIELGDLPPLSSQVPSPQG
jgi:hypothetical protein